MAAGAAGVEAGAVDDALEEDDAFVAADEDDWEEDEDAPDAEEDESDEVPDELEDELDELKLLLDWLGELPAGFDAVLCA